MDRPLFVPLRREFFDAFAAGTKREEWRKLGPGWNAHTCRIGRPVTLALGYRGSRRLAGVITGFRTEVASGDAVAIYGDAVCAVIEIKLQDV
jgi:hypothetical protein